MSYFSLLTSAHLVHYVAKGFWIPDLPNDYHFRWKRERQDANARNVLLFTVLKHKDDTETKKVNEDARATKQMTRQDNDNVRNRNQK